MRARIFRLVLRLCPRDFRDRFGDDVLHTAEALDQARPAHATDAPRVVVDAIRTVRAVRREIRFEARGRTAPSGSLAGRVATRLAAILTDVSRAARGLWRAPRFALTTIGVFASGIGVTTAVFAVFASVAMPRLAVHDADGLRFITAAPPLAGIGHEDADAVNDLHDIFGSTAFAVPDRSLVRSPLRNLSMAGESVSANYFAVVGPPLQLGRGLGPDDARTDAPAAVVISAAVWHRVFQDDPAILGKSLPLPTQWPWPAADGGQAFTVVGVMDDAFRGTQGSAAATDYWVAFSVRANDYRCINPPYLTNTGGNLIARLRDGVTDAQAQVALNALADQRRSLHHNDVRWKLVLADAPRFRLPFRLVQGATADQFTWGVFALASVLFAIVMFNLAGMLLARGLGRQGQIAVRVMLGASRARVVWETFAETLLVAAIGALAGVGVAKLIATSLVASVPMPASAHTAIAITSFSTPVFDWRTVAFAGALCAIGAVLAGLLPALKLSRPAIAMGTPAGVSSSFSGGRKTRSNLRLWIIVPQLALSLGLLVVGAVLVRAVLHTVFMDRGYDVGHVSYVSFDLPHPNKCDPETVVAAQYTAMRTNFYQRVSAALSARPEIASFGLTLFLPWEMQLGTLGQSREGFASRQPARSIREASFSPGLFETLHVSLRAGRLFDARDDAETALVAIVNESLARVFWPNQSAIGRFVGGSADPDGLKEPQWREVVGVVADVRHNESEPQPMMYLPSMDHHYAQAVLARTKDDRSGAAEALAAVVHEADPRAAVFQVESADAALHALSAGQRFSAVLLAAGGCGGLLLAMLGLYGVVSYAVTQRTREIGIRHALGAARRDILRLFLRDGLIASAIGIAAGVAIGVEGVRAVGYVIYDAPHADVVSCTIVTLALSGAVFFACLLPALRATRVDPVDALRTL